MTPTEYIIEKAVEANPSKTELRFGMDREITIRLAGILLAIEALNRGNKVNDFNKLEYGLNGKRFWIGNSITHESMDYDLLKDDIRLQSPETQLFIAKLLGYKD